MTGEAAGPFSLLWANENRANVTIESTAGTVTIDGITLHGTLTDYSGYSYSGGAGSQFVLLGTDNAAAPLSLWTRLQTNFTSPGNFTITPGSDLQGFFQ